MIITGIHCQKDLKNLKPRHGSWAGRRLPSITLYDEAWKLEDGDILAEEILLAFSDRSRTFKRTYANRFESFDREVVELISKYFPSSLPMRVHDVGVSDARTSCDFFGLLREDFPDLEYTASDLRSEFFVVEDRGSKAVFDSEGTLLELIVPPFVYNIHKPEKFLLYPVNYIHRAIAMARVVPSLKAKFRSGKDIKKLLLICPKARELAESDSRFRLVQHNLLEPLKRPEKFTLVRAMNVLNRSYFSEDQMRTIVSHIIASMMEGALFITGSNQGPGSSVKGAVYRKVGEGFSVLWNSAKAFPDAHKAITMPR